MRTSNPVFTSYIWRNSYGTNKMTINGILLKTLYTLFLLSLTAWYVWSMAKRGESVTYYIYGGMLVAVVFSVLTSYKKRWSPVTVPFYALAKGAFLGGISAFADNRFEGLPTQAVKISIITFFVMLLLYKLNIVKVTHQFRSVIYSAIATIMTVYIISFILRFFDIHLGIVYGTSWFYKAPKYMEWVATWGILVSLIWLYVEVLRLMKKLAIRF